MVRSMNRAFHEEFARKVIDYYLNVANRERRATATHFRETFNTGLKRVYAIIKRYEERGTVSHIRFAGRPAVKTSVENMDRLAEMYRNDPSISTREAGHILGMTHKSAHRLLKIIKENKVEEFKKRQEYLRQRHLAVEAAAAEKAKRLKEDTRINQRKYSSLKNSSENEESSDYNPAVVKCEPEEIADDGGLSNDSFPHDIDVGVDNDDDWIGMDLDDPPTPEKSPKRKVQERKSSRLAKIRWKARLNVRGRPVMRRKETRQPSISVQSSRTKRCLVCNNNILDNENYSPKHSRVEVNTRNIFVLKKILGMSSEDLVKIMGGSGGNCPETWISVCYKCGHIVDEAVFVHEQIRKLERRLLKCQEIIIREIQNASESSEASTLTRARSISKKKSSGQESSVSEKIRYWVHQNCYGNKSSSVDHDNPFDWGDQQAEILVNQGQSRAIIPHAPDVPIPVKKEFNLSQLFPSSGNDLSEKSVTSPVVLPCTSPEPQYNFPSAMELQLHSPENDENPDLSFLDNYDIHEPRQDEGSISTAPSKIDAGSSSSSIPPNLAEVPALSSSKAESPKEVTTVICDICGETLLPKTMSLAVHKLKKHDIVMDGFTLFKCDKPNCNYKTLWQDLIEEHNKRKHSTVERPRKHVCVFCGKGFLWSKDLKMHEQIHKNAETRPYRCECGSAFAVPTYLYIHQRNNYCRNKNKAASTTPSAKGSTTTPLS